MDQAPTHGEEYQTYFSFATLNITKNHQKHTELIGQHDYDTPILLAQILL
jgi:hypothetical protein